MIERKNGIVTKYPDDMIDCGMCHTLDYRTMIAHLMMCNYRDGIATQSVVECIEDTHAQLRPDEYEARVATLAYERGRYRSMPEIAREQCMLLPVFYCWRLKWLRRLAVALEDHGLLHLDKQIISTAIADGATERCADDDNLTAYADFPIM